MSIQNTREGHFLLAKARYAGARADRTRLPTAAAASETDEEGKAPLFEANLKVRSPEKLLENILLEMSSLGNVMELLIF